MEAMDLYELVKQDENELEIFLEDHPDLFTRIDKVIGHLFTFPFLLIPAHFSEQAVFAALDRAKWSGQVIRVPGPATDETRRSGRVH